MAQEISLQKNKVKSLISSLAELKKETKLLKDELRERGNSLSYRKKQGHSYRNHYV